MSRASLVRAENYSVRYPEAEVDALDGLTFEVERAQRIAVLGAGGSGRSTLCRALAGLIPGQVAAQVDGVLERPGRIGYVSQDAEASLIEPRVGDDVGFGLSGRGRAERIALALAAVGLEGYEGRATGELSGGQVQRVAIAGALARGADLQVLDDPTSELDAAGRADVLRALGGSAAVIATADPEVARWADRALVLHQGRVAFDGPPGELFAEAERARELGVRVPGAPSPRPPSGLVPGETVAEVRDLHFSYPGAITALDGANLSVRRGEIVALRGPNGAGKSTLARCLMGILPTREGEVAVHGTAAMVLQNPDTQLFADTVEDEVGYALRGRPDRQARVADALARVGLTEQAATHPRRLARSRRQLVAVASALALRPNLLILDEPTAGLDANAFDLVVAAIADAALAGAGVLLVTHDEQLAHLATRIVAVEAPAQSPAPDAATPAARRWSWDPRATAALTGVAVIAAIIASGWQALAGLTLVAVALTAAACRGGLRRWASAMLPLMPVVVFMGVFAWWLPPSWVADPAEYAAAVVLRLLAMVSWSVFLLAMVDVEETVALVRGSRFPPSLILVVTMALRFIPTLRRRLTTIREAQQARGVSTGKGPAGRLRGTLTILLPLFVGAIASANDLAAALLVRGAEPIDSA